MTQTDAPDISIFHCAIQREDDLIKEWPRGRAGVISDRTINRDWIQKVLCDLEAIDIVTPISATEDTGVWRGRVDGASGVIRIADREVIEGEELTVIDQGATCAVELEVQAVNPLQVGGSGDAVLINEDSVISAVILDDRLRHEDEAIHRMILNRNIQFVGHSIWKSI